MPSGNCNLQKCPHRPKMANSAYNGCECQEGKGSEEGRGDHMYPYMEYLWRIWHKQGPSSQTTYTIILDKTTKYVMKYYTIFTFCLLTKNKPDYWVVFFPAWSETNKVTVPLVVGGGGTGGTILRLATVITWESLEQGQDRDSVCSTWSPAETQRVSGWTIIFFQMDGGENFFILLHTNVNFSS